MQLGFLVWFLVGLGLDLVVLDVEFLVWFLMGLGLDHAAPVKEFPLFGG
jgi:hypothetical protein